MKFDFSYKPPTLLQFAGICVASIALPALPLVGHAIAFCWNGLASFLRANGSTTDTPIANFEIIKAILIGAAGLLGLAFAWWRSICLGKQTHIAEQGLVTDRFIKATEQLGSPNLSVRIGAIHSLWRIYEDSSESDKIRVLDTLCAFIRTPPTDNSMPQKTSCKSFFKHKCDKSDLKTCTGCTKTMREDVSAALKLILSNQNNIDYIHDISCVQVYYFKALNFDANKFKIDFGTFNNTKIFINNMISTITGLSATNCVITLNGESAHLSNIKTSHTHLALSNLKTSQIISNSEISNSSIFFSDQSRSSIYDTSACNSHLHFFFSSAIADSSINDCKLHTYGNNININSSFLYDNAFHDGEKVTIGVSCDTANITIN
ncbi:hypothetical protein [Desulfovibrio psychrotolerans]|nr:hypothetical protein [Desulfovibrio psychrotolerans]